MSLTINSNIAALRAQRTLAQTSGGLQATFERLSSGQRINRASDDAAGLSIASALNADRAVFSQGVRNLNDGLSLLAIADGAVAELSNVVVRLAELAEQAANGTLSHVQRAALDEEAQALSKEFTRIARTTEFNGRKLFDYQYGELRLQVGYGEKGAIEEGLGGDVGTGEFGPPNSYSTGAFSVATGDFNGDGALDFVTANPAGNTASVLLGDGAGGFGTAIGYATGAGPRGVSTGDFNGDGVLDLVTTNSSDSTASILLGDGTGGFGTAKAYAVGATPWGVSTGDFNGDGALDIVTADLGNSTTSVLLGDGAGGFGTATAYTVGATPLGVATADFNNDRALDIVAVSDNDGTRSVLLGDGAGGFGTAKAYTVGIEPWGVATADFNGDGALDLVTANESSGAAAVALGDGAGGFGAATAYVVGSSTRSVATGDFNGDGAIDIVAADWSDNTTGVLLGDGLGGFGAATTYFLGAGKRPLSVATADFDGDGVLDLVTADQGGGSASVLLGNTTDGVAPLLPFSLATMADARQALPVFKRKIGQLASQRAQIGAFQSRISTAANATQIATENFAAAASQILDADIAQESAALVRQQILQQAGTAILGQANQLPALALTLLG